MSDKIGGTEYSTPQMRTHRIREFVIDTFVGAVVLGIAIGLTPSLRITGGFMALLGASLITAALDTFLRPLMIRMARPFGWLGAVALALFANAIVMYLAIKISPGIGGDTFTWAFLGAWIFAIINSFAQWALVADTDQAFVAQYVKSSKSALAREPSAFLASGAEPTPGIVFIQLDGVPAPVLEFGIKSGTLPTLSRMVRSGSHALTEWVAQIPCTTPVSQAGLLHGSFDNMPAFRWYEKESKELLVANHPPDAKVMESRVSDGKGLLADGGWSVSNLFSGDASRRVMVISGLRAGDGIGSSQDFAAFFANPFGLARSMVGTIAEMVKEVYERRVQVKRGIEPRIHRHKDFLFLRGVTNVLLRDVNTAVVIQGMMAGTPSIYVDYVDYDEVAHHAGVLRSESRNSLEGLDRVVAMLEAAAKHAPRPYHFVLLSDHGQSQGATFLQRYGVRLEDLVRELMGGGASVSAATSSIEGWGPVNIFIKQMKEESGLSGKLTRRLAKEDDKVGGESMYGPGRDEMREVQDEAGSDLVVVGSGNLGGIWFARHTGRLTFEQISTRYPELLDALANHPGIAFVVVQTSSRGPVAIGAEGIHFLAEDVVEGASPLGDFGPYARTDFLRAASFTNAPDIYVNSVYDPVTDEVAAFEELVGCHGGLGGWQTRPFLMHPLDLPISRSLLDEHGNLAGADTVHRQLVDWLVQVGVRPRAVDL